MEAQQNEPFGRPNARPGSAFFEETRIFLQNLETLNRTQARAGELARQINTLLDEIHKAQIERIALREAIDRQRAITNQALIGRPSPARSPGTAPEELHLLLSALNDMEEKLGFIDELHHDLQRQELEQLKRWARDKKNWLGPEAN